MNPFGSMMGFGMGPNLFSGGMPFYNPFPRMPMYGGGLGGFGGFGGMGGGFNPFMMSPPPMQRFPRYDSLIPMQSQMPSQSLQNLPYQPKRPEMTSIEESSPMMQSDTQQTTSINPMTTEPVDMENRPTPSFTPFDPSGLQARIGDLEGRQMFDPSGLKSRIDALENRQMPTFTPFDPTGLQSQISALQNRQMFDPTGLQTRIGDLEGRQMFDPSGLKSRISKLESQFQQQPSQQLNMQDIEALIEQRLGNIPAFGISNPLLGPTPSQDFGLQTDPNFKKDPTRPYRMFIGQGGPGDI
tara:strand:+ start:94 stop:987 length:894 start_codon:yes stop_codon:yes gene_type:complete